LVKWSHDDNVTPENHLLPDEINIRSKHRYEEAGKYGDFKYS